MHMIYLNTVHSIVWWKVTPKMFERFSSFAYFVLPSEILTPNLYSSPINMDVRAWTELTKLPRQRNEFIEMLHFSQSTSVYIV